MSKGSKRRPPQIPKKLYDLNYDFIFNKITKAEYRRRFEELKSRGIIKPERKALI